LSTGMSPLRLHVASAGNEFMAHIAGLFAEGFRAEGVACDVVIDGSPLEDAEVGAQSIVVAPHEYFALHFLRTRPTIELEATLAAVAVLNVEQPGSEWFEVAWEFARRARHVFDISKAGVAEFQRRGVAAVHAPIGYTRSLEAPALRPTAERPIDVLFFGHASPRRNAFFARHADFFSACNCHIVVSEVHRPRQAATAGYRSDDERLRLVASSRIVLCVHSTERPYFEQHRAILALANRCLLVTETSRHTEPLVDGVHFVSAGLEDLPALCRRYLADPAAVEKVASAGRELATTRMHIRQSCGVMLEALQQTRGRASATEDHPDTLARDEVRARLAESGARLATGQTPWTTTANAAYASSTPPAVTVLVTLFDYRRYVARCLDSVLAAIPPSGGLEIVVVDDGSSDGGPDLVESVMASAATPMLLARKALNSGLADARNVGLTLARGRQVFVLDADNWIYPPCLAVLQAALDEGGLAATYGLIASIEEETGQALDLMSPLIDYGWFGWEDYDLWLKLAQAGKACRLVPRILSGYRDHGASMLRRTNRSSERLARYFKTKFAALLSQHPGLDTHFAFPAEDKDWISPEQAEIQRLRAHTIALERQLADVYASKSWQVTSPLRAALDWLGKKDRT